MNKKLIEKILFIVALLVIVALVIWIIASNANKGDEKSNREYDAAEVEAAAVKLLEESKLLNYIYWGEGIPYKDDKNLSSGSYYPADDIYLESIGIETIDDLKALTEKTYSKEMCETIYESILTSVYSDTGVVGLARYEQVYTGKDNDIPDYIRVYIEAKCWFEDTVEYHPEVEALYSEGDVVYVQILAIVTNPEGKVMNKNLTIGLIEEEDGWRLNTPTYAKYYEEQTS